MFDIAWRASVDFCFFNSEGGAQQQKKLTKFNKQNATQNKRAK